MLQNNSCKNNIKIELNKKNIEKFGTSLKNKKKGNNNNKIDKPTQDNLKDFISNLRKNFSSPFDHKGAKNFLKSKGKALKEIELNENILDKEDEIKAESKQKFFKNIKHKSSKGLNNNLIKDFRVNRHSSNEGIKTMKNLKIINNKKHANTVTENFEISEKKSKSKHKKLKSSKENNVLISNFILKEINIDQKRPKKFCSQMELKMFNDKNLNKLKPIKVRKHFSSKKQNIRINEANVHRTDTWKTDSTLFHLVKEINNI